MLKPALNSLKHIGFLIVTLIISNVLKFCLHFRKRYCIKHFIRGVAQPGRVLGLGPRCRMFESCRPDHYKKNGF